MTEPLVAGIELGGTKCIAVLARGREILALERLPTGLPAETLPALVSIVRGWLDAGEPIAALGLASFGPLALDPAGPDHGRITTTPKPGWAGTDLLAAFRPLGLPMALDTDVNAAALAEGRWGAAQGATVHVYLTIGTGLGGGAVVHGRALHGFLHPEMGHIAVRRTADLGFTGICPFHGDCLEGLASGPAIAARTGLPAELLADDHPIWAAVGGEIGALVAMLMLMLSPEHILIGGGVGSRPGLLDHVRAAAAARLAGYPGGLDRAALEAIVRPPALAANAGPLGAVGLGLACQS